MLLILLRHGTAEDSSPDEARELTAEGRKEVRAVARAMRDFGVRPDIVLSSRRARAIQTAQVVVKEMKLAAKIEQDDTFDFGSSWSDFESYFARRLAKEKNNLTILVAGHQPHIGCMIHMALQGTEADMSIRKGAAAGLLFKDAVRAGEAKLHFYLTPAFAQGKK